MQIQLPPTAEGQTYLYGRINRNRDVEHTILIAVNDERLPRELQREWAKSVGGVLFNRVDALIVYNEHRALVKPEAYWTDDDVEWDSAYAWCQSYGYGHQYDDHKSVALRGVAVSRLDRAARWIHWRRARRSISRLPAHETQHGERTRIRSQPRAQSRPTS